MLLLVWKALVVGAIAAGGAAAQNFTYPLTLPAANNPIFDFSGKSSVENDSTSPMYSSYYPDMGTMVCNSSTPLDSFVTVMFGGQGFCMVGNFPTTVPLALDAALSANSNQLAWSSLPTDGKKLCYGQQLVPAYTQYRIRGLNAVDNVTLNLVSNIPNG